MCCELALRIGNYRSINKKGTRGAGRAKWSNRSRAVPTPSHSRSGHSPACHCRHGHARCPMHPRVQADVFVSLTISSASTEAAACAQRPFVRPSVCPRARTCHALRMRANRPALPARSFDRCELTPARPDRRGGKHENARCRLRSCTRNRISGVVFLLSRARRI